jgi:hypothetical protein
VGRQPSTSASNAAPKLIHAAGIKHHAFAERVVRTIKSECLARRIFFVVGSMRHALAEYAIHYDRERNHQDIGDQRIRSRPTPHGEQAPVMRSSTSNGDGLRPDRDDVIEHFRRNRSNFADFVVQMRIRPTMH